MVKLFKLTNKLFSYWSKKISQNCWYIFIMIGEVSFFAISLLLICNLCAFYIKQMPYFSFVSQADIWMTLTSICFTIVIIFGLAHSYYNDKEEKKAKERLENRELSDYMEKYQEYVVLVEKMLCTKDYEQLHLHFAEWLKQFDKHLTATARLCQRQNKSFTNIEVAACLMYALTFYSPVDVFNIHLAFAFECAKQIMSKPTVYKINWLEGDELSLEVQETYDPIDFSILKEKDLPFVLSLLVCYLSQNGTYDQVLELADFLKILSMYCENKQVEY